MRRGARPLALAIVLVVVVPLATAVASPEAMKALAILEMREPTSAPDVTLSLLSGSRLSMKDLRGKAVLVNFWATWCVPCQWEMPLMENLYGAYKDRGFVVLAISLDQGDPARVQAFVADKKQFGVRGLPATLLVGPAGQIKGVTYGPKEWDGKDAHSLIASLLPSKKGAAAR